MSMFSEISGVDQYTARHLIGGTRREPRKTKLHAAGNIDCRTGAAAKRHGFEVNVHFETDYLVWPDMLGRFRPYVSRDWNFRTGKINVAQPDLASWPDFPGFGSDSVNSTPPEPDEETWRWLHIARSISSRYYELDIPAMPDLPAQPDRSVTYEDINNARTAINTLRGYFRRDGDCLNHGGKVTEQVAFLAFDDMPGFMAYAGVGMQDSLGDLNWSNVDESGLLEGRAEMNSTDQLTSLMFLELENSLRSLTHRGQQAEISGYTGGGAYDDGGDPLCNSLWYPYLASGARKWGNEFGTHPNTPGDAWDHRFDSEGVGNYGLRASTMFCAWNGTYVAGVNWGSDNDNEDWVFTVNGIGGKSQLIKNVNWYLQTACKTAGDSQWEDIYDLGLTYVGGQYASSFTLLSSTSANADATITDDDVAPSLTKEELDNPHPPEWWADGNYNGTARLHGHTFIYAFADIEWVFPSDANLGKTTKA